MQFQQYAAANRRRLIDQRETLELKFNIIIDQDVFNFAQWRNYTETEIIGVSSRKSSRIKTMYQMPYTKTS